MRDESSIQLDEDVRLMLKVREGDRSAYEKVYQRYFRTIVSFLAYRTGSTPACEDLAQEVFARVWRCKAHYQPLAPVKSYLFGVAVNVLRESRTRSRGPASIDSRGLEAMEDTAQASPLSQLQSAEEIRTVRAAMTSLPTRQRQALELVYLAGLSPGEAARRLGCSRQTLYSHLSSARAELLRRIRRAQER
jgi:RNA polymerase sigma-70 factor (ECF subfamily)